MEILSIIAPYLPGFILRWFFSGEKLATYIKVAVCDDRRGVYLNGGSIPNASVYLHLTNLSPFAVTIETLWVEVQFLGGRVADLATKLRSEIDAHDTAVISLEGSLTAPQCEFIARHTHDEINKHVKERQLYVRIEAELSCQVRRFQLFGRQITTMNVEWVNFRHAAPVAAPDDS